MSRFQAVSVRGWAARGFSQVHNPRSLRPDLRDCHVGEEEQRRADLIGDQHVGSRLEAKRVALQVAGRRRSRRPPAAVEAPGGACSRQPLSLYKSDFWEGVD